MLTDVMISARSDNKKTGPMPTISRPIESTCPTTCAFLPRALGGNGACYASTRINGTTKKYAADVKVIDAAERINKGKHKGGLIKGEHHAPAKYIRDRVVGDIIAPDTARDAATEAADVDYLLSIAELGRATDLIPYGYTHAFDLLTPGDVQRVAESGYVLNASCDDVESIERAVALGMPTTYAGDDVADGDIIGGRRILTCLAQVKPGESVPRARNCADCGLCAKPDRAVTVRFLMH